MKMKRLTGALCAALMLSASGAFAESPSPFPDFSAKRIKPPKAGAAKRITVQIEERANPAVPPPLPKSTTTAALTAPTLDGAAVDSTTKPVSLYDWFWTTIHPQSKETGPGRIQDALEVLSTPEGTGQLVPPRMQPVQDIAKRYGRDILLATLNTDVSPALVLAVIYAESAGNAAAISRTGAVGLMQLMPVTSDRFSVADPYAPADNIKGGVAFLDVLLKRYNGDPILALAGYNAGEGAVAEYGGVPPFAETMNYVPRVLSAYRVASGLCSKPPLFVSDPCVFAAIAE
ncbi:Transglycosylase SLT domain-containing protein [Cognatishimia maritima]|uniref:Transglycosylase SLT domain-containing protein n=2 Tax=Cognatishimia maritima TaxID=870908 RepID=A0A1M5KTX6_9RHOB|nr:Transglycosylase SLT domain-containing protein [Cognatishimia maritima]